MGQMKTPGVYIVEKSAFPNSVVEVATAVPAFIGYTKFAVNGGKSLNNKPWRITSMAEFEVYYGTGPRLEFEIEDGSGENKDFSFKDKDYVLKLTKGKFLLYYAMQLFFQNGGGPCYIVSVGNYDQELEAQAMKKGINLLVKEQEPTMVLIPEAVLLDIENCISVQQEALSHCGGKMKNRIAVLDVYDGFKDRQDPSGDCIDTFRNKLGINFLDYAAAYYPWINTTIIQDNDLSFEIFSNKDKLQTLLKEELDIEAVDPQDTRKVQLEQAVNSILEADLEQDKKIMLNKTLIQISPLFNTILKELKEKLNILPPSSAMAGVYTMVDNSKGVWKAPANVSLNSVVSPCVNISHDEQEDLNVTVQGKSINAIRSFIGEGVLVWGARTLDGNSLDWRYINVRRTMIMLEESIRLASKAYVFENNNANTWITIKSMIENFLNGIWKRGGLAGSSPADAFSVHVGLGETMTSEDILEGILRVTVLVALIRPAEFIEITFQQQMQKS